VWCDKSGGMKLSARLSAVARHVLVGEPVADVGTDHGQLPVSLLLSGQVPRVIASDCREGPLSSVRSLSLRNNLGAPGLEVRLSDGLSHLKAGEAATVTISGMGGALMASILEANPPSELGVRRLVLQPNMAAERLRAALAGTGWALVDEDLVAEGGYFYPVLVAERGEMVLTEEQALLGPILQQRRPSAWLAWLSSEVARLSPILEKASASSRETSAPLQKLQRRCEIIEGALALSLR
jgi:tRNA (adenine22-N1)-methyltransferase